jgi:hypothetical protein
MLSIHGTALKRQSAYRAVSGCLSITGSAPRLVAKHYRDFETELDL